MLRLEPQLLTREEFEPFGDVIEAVGRSAAQMNDGHFDRFNDLCHIDSVDRAKVTVGIVRSQVAISPPYRVEKVERHPLGSQAFIPLKPFRFVVVVGPAQESIEPSDLRAFVTNGRQGINYRRGTWHMPLVAFEVGQEFLVIDRVADELNLDELYLDEPVVLAGLR